MKLGDVAQITIGVPDLSASRAFYQKLNFQVLAQGEEPWPWVQLTDGQNLVLLNHDGQEYIGLNYFSTQLPDVVAKLEEMEVEIPVRREEAGQLKQVIFCDPEGFLVGLIEHNGAQLPKPDGTPLARCGKFGEFALPVADFDRAAAFWEQWGFYKLYQSQEPYTWGILGDSKIVLGLHEIVGSDEKVSEPLEFTQPTMTYFAADMDERIAQLKADGLPFAQELPDEDGHVANAVLQAPGKERLFLFQGDV